MFVDILLYSSFVITFEVLILDVITWSRFYQSLLIKIRKTLSSM
jgi:hypothetical protein